MCKGNEHEFYRIKNKKAIHYYKAYTKESYMFCFLFFSFQKLNLYFCVLTPAFVLYFYKKVLIDMYVVIVFFIRCLVGNPKQTEQKNPKKISLKPAE